MFEPSNFLIFISIELILFILTLLIFLKLKIKILIMNIYFPLIFCLLSIVFIFFLKKFTIILILLNLGLWIALIEFYLLLTRGFSVSIILTIDKYKELEIEDLKNKYADKGLEWFCKNRINGLNQINFIFFKNNKYFLKNNFISYLVKTLIFFRKFYYLDKNI